MEKGGEKGGLEGRDRRGGASVVGRWRVVAVPFRLEEREGLMEGVELTTVARHVEDHARPTGARVG